MTDDGGGEGLSVSRGGGGGRVNQGNSKVGDKSKYRLFSVTTPTITKGLSWFRGQWWLSQFARDLMVSC